jgi:hypothetical protein
MSLSLYPGSTWNPETLTSPRNFVPARMEMKAIEFFGTVTTSLVTSRPNWPAES